MHPARLLLVGLAGAVAALMCPAPATDAGIVEGFTGLGVPSIWSTLGSAHQRWILVAVASAAGLAAVPVRSRLVGMGVLTAAAGAGCLVWLVRGEVAAAGASLAADLDRLAAAGLIGSSPGAAPGPGFVIAFAWLVLAAAVALWELAARKREHAGPPAPEAADEPPGGTRYVELVIETDRWSLGE